jgi:hypothetical protein
MPLRSVSNDQSETMSSHASQMRASGITGP